MIKKRFRVKRSVIWKMPLEELKKVVSTSNSFSEILKHFELNNKGGNCKTLKRRLIDEKIDFSHIKLGITSNNGRKFPECSMTKEECLKNIYVSNSTWNRTSVKRYLKRYDLLPYKCECGIEDDWRGKKITLQLDHKNGVDNDHRIENLRWICPNCHSQTETYCGRNNLY